MNSANGTGLHTNFGELVIEFLKAYGMATTELRLASPLRALNDKAAERCVSRLLNEGKVVSHSLRGPRRYYTLSAETARDEGVYDGGGFLGMGPQALCNNYAIGASCVLGDRPKKRLTRDEFAAKLPMLVDQRRTLKHYRTRYFIDKSQKDQGLIRVGLFVVDFGQDIRRLAKKVRREVERRRTGLFADFVSQQLLYVCVLTAFEKKAKQICSALDGLPVPFGVEVPPGYERIIGVRG